MSYKNKIEEMDSLPLPNSKYKHNWKSTKLPSFNNYDKSIVGKWKKDIEIAFPSVDLHLISEKSIWKNQVRQTGFLLYFELDFCCLCSLQKTILKLIFVGYTGSKNQVRNSLNLHFVALDFLSTWFFRNQVQINRGSM